MSKLIAALHLERAMELDPSLHARLYPTKPREELNMTRSTRRRHALDEESRDLDAAYRHLYGAMDHLHAAREGKIDFDEEIYNDHVSKAADCLGGGTGKAGDSRPGARDALPRGMSRSADLDVRKLFQTGYDYDALMQREGD